VPGKSILAQERRTVCATEGERVVAFDVAALWAAFHLRTGGSGGSEEPARSGRGQLRRLGIVRPRARVLMPISGVRFIVLACWHGLLAFEKCACRKCRN